MKVQVVEEPRADGKKLVVQVVYKVNGKTKKQNKEIFGLNERRKAEKLRSQLENSEKVDVIDQKITFEFVHPVENVMLTSSWSLGNIIITHAVSKVQTIFEVSLEFF